MLSIFAGSWTGFWSGVMVTYLLLVLIGLLVPSWPINLFFAPLALLALAVQLFQRRWLSDAARRAHWPAALFGSLSMGGLWAFYFLG